MTWRERIAAAQQRKRGMLGWFRRGFTRHDRETAGSILNCAGHEVLTAYGLRATHGMVRLGKNDKGKLLFLAFPAAVNWGRIAEASRILDLMEDRALELKLKRGGTP
mgnify:CR=1 FL=1